MSQLTIYHNPKCQKSRQTLALLREKGLEPTIIEYLSSPPSKTQLKAILNMLKLEPRQLMRQEEPEYKELQLNDSNLTKEQLINAMIEHPRLIQRPIVVYGERAALGRPPESVLTLF
jgi:arsenate reductase